MVCGLGFRVLRLGFMVAGSGFRVKCWVLELRVWNIGSGFEVQDLNFRF